MNIEVGKTYEAKKDYPQWGTAKVIGEEWDMNGIHWVIFVDYFKKEHTLHINLFTGIFELIEPSKPAHYDTAIDTIAFAKANFSREQVEGFMRINAVKYIQRYEAKNGVDDVRKAVVYLNMLIEHLEEEGK